VSADLRPFDGQRLWLGDAPPLFLLEIAFRTGVMFLWVVLLLRLTGKRGLGQLSAVELAIVIALGSAVGDPMFYPEVPLLHAMLVTAIVVGLQRGLSLLVVRSEHVETFVEGTPIEVVRDGRISLSGCAGTGMSTEDLAQQLRVSGVRQLGEVQRAYFEQNGHLSVFRTPHPPSGLPIVPPWDLLLPRVITAGERSGVALACLQCAAVQADDAARTVPACPVCGHTRFTPAVTDLLA